MTTRSFDRRQFLGLAAAGLTGLNLLTRPSEAAVRLLSAQGNRPLGAPLLLLVQLSGGNDGINTLVPFRDPIYQRERPTIAHKEDAVLPWEGDLGLAPGLKAIHGLCQEGRASWVAGAGYPSANRSHFKSMEIWHTADERGRAAGPGWVTKLIGALHGDQAEATRLVHIGRELPYSMYSTRHPAIAFPTPELYRRAGEVPPDVETMESRPSESKSNLEFLREMIRDANASSRDIQRAAARYQPKVEYPNDEFARALAVAAALIDARIGSEVISVELSGFDTHNAETNRHRQQMERLDGALSAFLKDVEGQPGAKNLLVVCFSEFGRRLKENASGGTDHGAAGPMLLAGPRAAPGLHGQYPALSDLDDRGDLCFTTDFRRVYAAIAKDLFGADPAKVVGPGFQPLACVRA